MSLLMGRLLIASSSLIQNRLLDSVGEGEGGMI